MRLVEIPLAVGDKASGPLKTITGEMVKLTAATDKSGRSFAEQARLMGTSTSALKGMFAAGAAAAAATAAMGAGLAVATRRVMEMGGDLADMSAKTGVGVEALQKLGHAAKLGGSTMADAARAVNIFQKNLASGEGAKIFKQLGLDAAELKRQLPEDAFLATAEAIRSLTNPTEQAAAAMTAFGKSGADLLPAIKAGLADAAAEAERLGLVLSAETVAAADALGDSVDTLTATWEGLLNQFGATVVESASVHALINGLTSILGDLSGAARTNQATLRDLVDNGVLKLADGLLLTVKAIGIASDAWGTIRVLWLSSINLATDLSIAMAKASRAMPWTSKEAKAGYTQDIALMQAYKASLADEAAAENAAMGDRKTAIAALEKQFDELRASVSAAAGKNVALGASAAAAAPGVALLSGEVQKLADRLKAAVAAGNPGAGVLGVARSEADQLANYLNGLGGQQSGIPGGGNPFDPGKAPGISFGQQFTVGFKEGIKQLPVAIMAAIQGGGDVARAIGATMGGSIGESLSGPLAAGLKGILGKTLSGALGAALPGVGALLGGIGGQLIGKLFGGGEHGRVNDLRDQFVAAAGGITELDKRAQAAGLTLDRLLAAKKVNDFEAAVRQLNDAFNLQDEAQQKLAEAVERYGFSIEQLGPKFQQQKLDEMAAQLIKDFKLLTASGIDQVVVLQQMGPAFQDYVNTAIAAGAALPESMRAMIEQLIAQGLLLDANGVAFTSIEQAGLSFTETMSEQFTKLIEKIEQLVNALLGIPNVERSVTVTTPQDIPGSPFPLQAARGFGPLVVPNLGRGLGPLIQTHAGELVGVLPASMVRGHGRSSSSMRFFGAAAGFGGKRGGDSERDRLGGGGGGLGGASTTSDSGSSGTSSTGTLAAAVEQLAASQARTEQTLTRLADRPQAVIPLTVNAPIDTTGLPRASQEQFKDEIQAGIAQDVRNLRGALFRALNDAGFKAGK